MLVARPSDRDPFRTGRRDDPNTRRTRGGHPTYLEEKGKREKGNCKKPDGNKKGSREQTRARTPAMVEMRACWPRKTYLQMFSMLSVIFMSIVSETCLSAIISPIVPEMCLSPNISLIVPETYLSASSVQSCPRRASRLSSV
ncbi:hypothetical protein B296_00054400 [Ensete ventricosum]|uniref:Uncharacterized protein n=1 Tax=Ensete ventricosum TaxID=4639 RepID=A0A426XCT7_ENSVE|nr:hypothetical protein B296_00054400 [Ensete ventricosum]